MQLSGCGPRKKLGREAVTAAQEEDGPHTMDVRTSDRRVRRDMIDWTIYKDVRGEVVRSDDQPDLLPSETFCR
jgi:hypothetical protein